MATNGILDITTEEYMGRDPEMEILPGSDDMLEIKKTLEIVGVPQEQYGEFTERFMEWRKRNNGTFDMFLEEIYQLPPGTITKIKTEQQVARGPQDMQTEDEMTIQPGSGDMLDIMQSVGAPQRAAGGGRIGYGLGSWLKGKLGLGKREGRAEAAPDQSRVAQDPELMREKLFNYFKAKYSGKDNWRDRFRDQWTSPFIQAAQGGRIGYQAGEQVLPMPRPTEEDSRLEFFKRMGAMPEQTLLRRAQPMNAMRGQVPEGIMGQTPDPFGGLLGGQEGDIGMGGQPLVEYEHEGAEEPPSWWDKMRTGTHDAGVAHTPDIDMQMIIDFLKKMGMAITKENIAKAAKALGMAMKFGPMGASTSLGLQGLGSLGAPEEIEETEEIGFQDGGAVPRQGFFVGKVVKAVTGGAKKLLKSAKKILKSDLGKMALMYIATAGFSNVAAQQGLGGAQRWGGFKWLQPGNVAANLGSAAGRVLGPLGTETAAGATTGTWLNPAGGVGPAGKGGQFMEPFLAGGKKIIEGAAPWYKNPMVMIPGAMLAGGLYTAKNPGEEQFDTGKRDAEVDKWTEWLAGIPPADDIVYPYPNYAGAQGGRVGRQEGGIMDLDGGEKDYRNTGGFVDIGAKEKADDVPARLSVNEFVMTADAVRGAGDGDVEEGAERLQDTMKQLEQKGKRHKAAQGMFATSQRLGEVI